MKICTYNNNKRQQQTTLEHTYAVIYYYCVNDWQNKFITQQHFIFYQNIFTHYFKENMFSHWTMTKHGSRWQFKSHSNEDNYSLPYQNIGIARIIIICLFYETVFPALF